MYPQYTTRSTGRTSRLAAWWRQCAAPLRLVVINTVLFLIVKTIMLTIYFAVPGPGASAASLTPLAWLSLPDSLTGLLLRPWTLLTYMFTHHDAWHLLFNMLWLYMFGNLLTMACNGRQLTGLYIIGGAGGAVMFQLLGIILPGYAAHGLEGASASVIAIIVAVMVLMPQLQLRLMLFGQVKALWIGIITLVLLGYNGLMEPGALAAHIGGALTGLAFGLMMRRGRDITAPVNHLADRFVNLIRSIPATPKRRHRTTADHRATAASGAPQSAPGQGRASTPDRSDIADILEKVKRSGYGALNAEERARLFGHRK